VAECTLPSLKLLEIKVPTMEWPILNDCSQTLQEVFIRVASYIVNVEDADRKLCELSRIVERMPCLKVFTLWVDDDDANIISKCAFNVRSSTLEALTSNVSLGDCLCPALRMLRCTGEIRLGRICTSSSYSSLQFLELGYDGSVADINRWLDRLSSMIENMHSLKTLRLNSGSLNDGSNKISLRSATVELIKIYGMELTKCNCPMLKALYTTNLSSAMTCSQQLEKLSICCPSLKSFRSSMGEGKVLHLSKRLEDLSIEIYEYPLQDGTFEALSHLIEQLPNLKNLNLNVHNEGTLSIKSSSLENIDVTASFVMFKVSECICPSLQKFLVTYSASYECNNGVQLDSSRDTKIKIAQHGVFPLSEWDFIGMKAPRSCVVWVEEG